MTQQAIKLSNVKVSYKTIIDKTSSLQEYTIKLFKKRIRYEDYNALYGIDLEIEKGKSFGVIGNNGAGKSTLLKVISKVIRPIEGRVQIWGRVMPLIELSAGFDIEMTGRENIYLNGTLLGFSRREMQEKETSIIKFSGIESFIDSPVRTYSSGMKGRLGFAIATDTQPDILIVDEVLSVGDASFREKCSRRIENYHKNGTTILLVSHNIGLVRKLCTEALLLEKGRILKTGPVDSVTQYYLNRVKEEEKPLN